MAIMWLPIAQPFSGLTRPSSDPPTLSPRLPRVSTFSGLFVPPMPGSEIAVAGSHFAFPFSCRPVLADLLPSGSRASDADETNDGLSAPAFWQETDTYSGKTVVRRTYLRFLSL